MEHARCYVFGRGDTARMYISSSDWMTRSMERRVEVAVPIYQKHVRTYILEWLENNLKDNVNGMWQNSTGNYEKRHHDLDYDSQKHYLELYQDTHTAKKKWFNFFKR